MVIRGSVRERGMTLIELLISITILTLLIGIATYSLSLFSHDWSGRGRVFSAQLGQLRRTELMVRAIESSIPWIVTDAESRPGFYFLGRPEGFTFVTSDSIFSPGGLAVVRVFREPIEGALKWRLVYEEAPIPELRLTRANQVLPFKYRLVIIPALSELSFSYFGWGSLDERLSEPGPSQAVYGARWFSDYDGVIRRESPSLVMLRSHEVSMTFVVPQTSATTLKRFVRE